MEREFLLEELAKLKRIIKNHENVLAVRNTTPKNDVYSNKKCCSFGNKSPVVGHSHIPDTHTSMIFVNPNFPAQQQVQQHSQSVDNKKTVKIFINPNFPKSRNPPNKHQNQLKVPSNSKISHLHSLAANDTKLKRSSEGTHICKDTDVMKTDPLKRPELEGSVGTRNNRIFINPNFSNQTKIINISTSIDSHKAINTRMGTRTENCEANVQSQLEDNRLRIVSKNFGGTSSTSAIKHSPAEVERSNVKKRKIYLNQYLHDKGSSANKKKRKSTEGSEKSVNKIFLNPKFERELDDKVIHKCNVAKPALLSAASRAEDQTVCKSKAVLSFPNGCLTGPTYQKERVKSEISQRPRTRSTSLISLSRTKLVNKRKFIRNAVEQTNNRPVFVSKTKLVRNPLSEKLVNNHMAVKLEEKQTVSKSILQCLTPDKVNKMKKQSFISVNANLANITKKSAVVTKIRSKNGKSLKLIRKNVETNSSALESSRIKSVQKHKHLIKQQAIRNALCIAQNKLRKNQFLKINVPMRRRSSQSLVCNRNAYKNKYSIQRKIPTKTPLLDKKMKCLTKIRGQCASERKNLMQSKYRFVRKQSFSSDSKPGRSRKLVTSNKANLSISKRKWNASNKSHRRRGLSIVNIGGEFYCCSRTSLTKNKPPIKKVLQRAPSKGLLVNIGGKKYQFENNGRTLTCLDKKLGRKRIDIGGVTFISSSSGTSLTRTNYHTARSILAQAKQKSISLLTRKLKKNNEPCPFFHRFGRCSAKERGTCTRQHDPKYVAVCKKFVQGSCVDSQCLLSHTISCHNMPTCQHFLAGQCGRDNCPYPHIKVNDRAPVCLDFLKGFCSLGDECTKRHHEICPSFEKGTCSRGKYCPYPHPKSKTDQKLKGKLKYLKKTDSQPPRDAEPVSNCILRYFEDVNLQKENEVLVKEDAETSEENSVTEIQEEKYQPLKQRPKLGRLPSFIPLSCDDKSIDNVAAET